MLGVRRALLFSFGDRYIVLAVNFATIAVVSRILTPAEIGVSVVGMAIVGLAMTLREFASANFVIQRRDLRPEIVRSAFTLMLALTSGIALILVAAAPFLTEAYDEADLATYLRVISVSLFVELIWSQIVTLLKREMAFGKIAVINLGSAASAAATTILLAVHGFSYMSFAWGWLAAATVASILALCVRRDLSIFVPCFENWREMLAFGGYNGANVLLYKLFEQAPYLVMARAISADAAALFSRSVMIAQMPDKIALGGVVAVALPAFAVAAREGRCLRELYLRALALVAGLLWPAHLVLAILAFPVVDLLLGHQWHEAAALVQIVALASLFTFGFELNYPVLVAVGGIRDVFLRAVIVFPSAALLVSLAAIFGGLHGAALSLFVVLPLNAWVGFHFVLRRLDLNWSDLAGAVRMSALLGLSSAAGPLAVVFAAGTFELGPAHGALGAALAGLGWLVGARLTEHPLATELGRGAAAIVKQWSRHDLIQGTGR